MSKNGFGAQTKKARISVSLEQNVYDEICRLACEHNVSMAYVIRFAVENRLKEYLGTIRYIDKAQGAEIIKYASEISDNSRHILSNIRRIGVNYNQELRLKNAEQKYQNIIGNKYSSTATILAARDEYEKEKRQVESTCLDKDELYELLSSFEKLTDKMKELVCHIHV